MSESEGRKRLRPQMGRGSWRFSMWAFGLQIPLSAVLAITRLVAGPGDSWDVLGFWIYTVLFLLATAQVVHLLYIRRNDASFWVEDEARRKDLERRGRLL
jgi:hypothetical protein